MALMGRKAKVFVDDVEVTKLFAVTSFRTDLEASGLMTGTLEFYLDDLVMNDAKQEIRIGKPKKETFKAALEDRSLII